MSAFADILIRFGDTSKNEQTVGGRGGASWDVECETSNWQLRTSSVGTSSSSLLHHVRGSGLDLWCLGEIYQYESTPRAVTDVLYDCANAIRANKFHPEKLNGHFLLFAWEHRQRRWHVWTNRFGTLHAYHATNGNLAAIGTFLDSVSACTSIRELDWIALTGFFAFGFFPQARTHFDGASILRPASHYAFSDQGRLLAQDRYWQWWHEPDLKRSYIDTVAELADTLGHVMADLSRHGRIAVPISGGLDSRSTVAALNGDGHRLNVKDRLWSYSYGYTADSIETSIAQRIAATNTFPFQSFTIEPYLFDWLDLVLSSVEGFQDVTQCRQAMVVKEISQEADYLIAAHWGDVWLDDMGMAVNEQQSTTPEQIAGHALKRILKEGRHWLLEHLCRPKLDGDLDNCLSTMVNEELSRVAHVSDPDFRIKAFKTDQWSFRWTTASLRMYQAAAFPRLPFYDTRLSDFFCTVPTKYVAKRQLQIDYLKRFAPALARITWQAYDTNLFWHRHFNSWLLPKRALKKMARLVARKQRPERNWEVQFLNKSGRAGLTRWLLDTGLKLHEFVPVREVKVLLDNFYAAPFREKRGYTVSMLLTFSAWLERHG